MQKEQILTPFDTLTLQLFQIRTQSVDVYESVPYKKTMQYFPSCVYCFYTVFLWGDIVRKMFSKVGDWEKKI